MVPCCCAGLMLRRVMWIQPWWVCGLQIYHTHLLPLQGHWIDAVVMRRDWCCGV